MSNNIQSREENKNDTRTEPDRDPQKADKKSHTTCVGKLDRAAKAREQLRGPHMFHNIKYGSEELLGMSSAH